MDIYTLALFSSLLAVLVGFSLLLTSFSITPGYSDGITCFSYAALTLSLSISPLLFGFTQSSPTVVFFSNSTYTIALSLFVIGLVIFRGANNWIWVVCLSCAVASVYLFVISTFLYPSTVARLEVRSGLALLLCLLAIHANQTGYRDDDKRAQVLLTGILIIHALYDLLRIFSVRALSEDFDLYAVSNFYKLSFVITGLSVVGLAFVVFWMLTTRLLRQLNDSSVKDELTGLYNRKELKKYMPRFGQQEWRENCFVLIADLDNFKCINDTFGHEQGDKVIQQFAEVIKSQCRKEDICFRFGGEEFLIILPNTSEVQALQIADRIRQRAKDRSIEQVELCHYTVSIGLARATYESDWQSLFANADKALYEAKSKGRDCVILYS